MHPMMFNRARMLQGMRSATGQPMPGPPDLQGLFKVQDMQRRRAERPWEFFDEAAQQQNQYRIPGQGVRQGMQQWGQGGEADFQPWNPSQSQGGGQQQPPMGGGFAQPTLGYKPFDPSQDEIVGGGYRPRGGMAPGRNRFMEAMQYQQQMPPQRLQQLQNMQQFMTA